MRALKCAAIPPQTDGPYSAVSYFLRDRPDFIGEMCAELLYSIYAPAFSSAWPDNIAEFVHRYRWAELPEAYPQQAKG
jgi:hypothetical protein